jgi:hypothetical protein
LKKKLKNESLPYVSGAFGKGFNNFLVGLKKKVGSKSTMHLGELAEWCLNNLKVPKDTEEMQDEPFVVCYSVFLGDEDEVPVDQRKIFNSN